MFSFLACKIRQKIVPVPIPVHLCRMPGCNTAESSLHSCCHFHNLAGHSPAEDSSVHSLPADHSLEEERSHLMQSSTHTMKLRAKSQHSRYVYCQLRGFARKTLNTLHLKSVVCNHVACTVVSLSYTAQSVVSKIATSHSLWDITSYRK